MFGVDDLNTCQIYQAHINEVTLKNNQIRGGDVQLELVEAAHRSARLTAFTFENMADSLEYTLYVCTEEWTTRNDGSAKFPLLKSLNLTGELLVHRVDGPDDNATRNLLASHSGTLTTIRFTKCTITLSTWQFVLEVLPTIPGLRASNVSIVDCKAVWLVDALDDNGHTPTGDPVVGDPDWFWDTNRHSMRVHGGLFPRSRAARYENVATRIAILR
jgi:hypothetical protein